MNQTILNRDFQHPSDGWYQIEALGEHPNRAAGVVQVIDAQACQRIVNRFNREANDGTLRHGKEMLIDHEHFSDNPEQETRAYGWLQELQNRADGIYGRIRWTTTGKAAVDGGDYRFFSTEYEPSSLEAIGNTTNRSNKKVRPLQLDGLSLTNMNNNRGQKPITNRSVPDGPIEPAGPIEEFRRGAVPAAGSKQTNPLSGNKQRTTMKSVATRLGLSAEASEEAILAEVTSVMNRATEAQSKIVPLNARVTALENENATLLTEQIDADFATAGIKDEKIINRHKPLLSDGKHFKNREERVAFIADLVKPAGAGATTAQRKLANRDTIAPAGDVTDGDATTKADQAKATKIMNRAVQIKKETPNVSDATACIMAQREIENAS